MSPTQYIALVTALSAQAREKLAELAAVLQSVHGRQVGLVDYLEQDDEAGWTMSVRGNGQLYVELLVASGPSRGFEGAGLVLSCSWQPSGTLWTPGNFSGSVGAPDAQALAERLAQMDVAGVAAAIESEWLSVEASQHQWDQMSQA